MALGTRVCISVSLATASAHAHFIRKGTIRKGQKVTISALWRLSRGAGGEMLSRVCESGEAEATGEASSWLSWELSF